MSSIDSSIESASSRSHGESRNYGELAAAIEKRRSRRAYIPAPLCPETVDKLEQLIACYAKEGGVRIELVLNNGGAFAGLRKSYGMFSGVRHYFGLIGNKQDPASEEKLGYYGELLVLNATALGLGSCWVGGTFDRTSCPFVLSEEETIACLIVIGQVKANLGKKEGLIYNFVHRKSKSLEEMCVLEGQTPKALEALGVLEALEAPEALKVSDWFLSGMKAVQKAPSAVNRQPVRFSLSGGKVTAWIDQPEGDFYAMDLGIAKCHFEIGASCGAASCGAVHGRWHWGNHAEFLYEE